MNREQRVDFRVIDDRWWLRSLLYLLGIENNGNLSISMYKPTKNQKKNK